MAREASQMTYSVPFGCVDDQVYWLCTTSILEMIGQHISGFVSKLHGWPKLNHRLTRVLIISDRWVCSNYPETELPPYTTGASQHHISCMEYGA